MKMSKEQIYTYSLQYSEVQSLSKQIWMTGTERKRWKKMFVHNLKWMNIGHKYNSK